MLVQEPRLKEIVPQKIEPAFMSIRAVDMEFVKELAQSIQSKGLRVPIEVRWLGENRYRLVDGVHRLEAAKLLKLPRISAIVHDRINEADEIEIMLTHNTQRLAFINPWLEGKAYVKLQQERYKGLVEMGRSIGKSRSYISLRMRVFLKLNPLLIPKIGNEISINNAIALSYATSGRQLDIAKALIERRRLPPIRVIERPRCKCPSCGNSHQKRIASGF